MILAVREASSVATGVPYQRFCFCEIEYRGSYLAAVSHKSGASRNKTSAIYSTESYLPYINVRMPLAP